MTIQSTSSMSPTSPVTTQWSPWHSPVPYLFGGLAAMMGLIAFALLILACSYWKLSHNMQNEADGERDLEADSGDGDIKLDNNNDNNNKTPTIFEDNYLVIMAGQEKPTFLATPSTSRASSFGGSSFRSSSTTTSTNDLLTIERERDESSRSVAHVSAERLS